MTTIDLLLVIVGYLSGSLSAAIIVCKLLDLPDPRSQGSRNPGATNVLRYGGKRAAAAALAGDLLKGLLPVVLAHGLGAEPLVVALVAMAAFLGHLYPIFFGFEGGKGVATAMGVLLGLAWQVALASLICWLLMVAIFRLSSLAALTAATLSPLIAWWLLPQPEYIVMLSVMALLLIWRHRTNIVRIVNGSEGRVGR